MDSNTAISEYRELLDSNENYTLTGQMDIISNEELYHYDVEVSHMKDNYYKATLVNKDNNYEQVILKNNDGVYVITPSLNKSFKFESEWPFNSSQAYILDSLLYDLENDSNVIFEESEEEYMLYSTVNYPNNSTLVSQKITFDKEMIPKLVEVYDKDGIADIVFKIINIDFEKELSTNDFAIESSVSEEISESVGTIDEVVYPMYLPTGTVFESEETVKTDQSERVILTFTGDKSFTLIEEVSALPSEFEITSTPGELVFYENVLGTLTETSLNWTMNGKDYYIISDNLTNEELLKVASSTSVVSLTK